MQKSVLLMLVAVVGLTFGALTDVASAGEHGGKEHGGGSHTASEGHAASSEKATIMEAADALAQSNPGLAARLRAIAGKKSASMKSSSKEHGGKEHGGM